MIKIIPFTAEHAAGVVSVILPIQQSEFGVPITLDAQPDLLDIPGFYQRNCGNFWVAIHGEHVVGTIGLLDIGNQQAALRKMFVAAAYRGAEQGVAKQLLDELLVWSAKQGIADILLGTTDKFVAAHRFYEKNGFAEVQKSSLPQTFPVMAVDSKFYRLALTPHAV
ncbi:GNAT family N-acetyltransferase [Rheinheimera sp. F8]|uniref:GNAT family N-acetyltransferase n=1 Tax=Rheinheimera sp. F8 TaxID=1763998 RepID=UPI000744C4BC|nr:GNAT family N-acetyltransferase [Rheinheimera sp. F8]ALZ75284.1 GNAT family acetyltransferase [Rheinheimera sp. F8]ALZ76290.1 GNAT family acetyltransferase [Rheinheimera sp. F8]